MYGYLQVTEDLRYSTMEREWAGNVRNFSCLPCGEYDLVPHDGTKYRETFALVNEGCSSAQEAGVPRFACVIHSARQPSELRGCLAVGHSIDPYGELVDSLSATRDLLERLNDWAGLGLKLRIGGPHG